MLDDYRSSEHSELNLLRTRGMDTHLRNEKHYTDKRQPTRNAGEPEPGPPRQSLDDVAVGEDPSVRIQSVDTIS